MNRPRLLIVRGLPGSGKSTYVRNNYPGLFTLETDCFNCVGGQYYWTPDRSKEAIKIIEDIVIRVAVYVIRKKSHPAFNGHKTARERYEFLFLFSQAVSAA